MCISTVPVVLLSGFLRFWVLARFQSESKKAYQESASYACEAVSAIRTIASLTRERGVVQNYKQQLNQQTRRSLRSVVQSSLLYAASQSVGFCVNALAFWYGGKLISQGELSMLQFFLCFSATVFGAQSAGMIFSFAPDIGKAKQAAADMKHLLDRTPKIDTWSESGRCLGVIKGNVDFRDVQFQYPIRSQPVLRGLNLHIKAGQYVALVGSSGSGKSTVISLLERFYAPDAGRIYLDGVDISSLNVNACRQYMALVAQEPTLYQGTIRQNILLGTSDERGISDDDIAKVCRDANIYEFIQSLPKGLDTGRSTKAPTSQLLTLHRRWKQRCSALWWAETKNLYCTRTNSRSENTPPGREHKCSRLRVRAACSAST